MRRGLTVIALVMALVGACAPPAYAHPHFKPPAYDNIVVLDTPDAQFGQAWWQHRANLQVAALCETMPNPGPVFINEATMRWCQFTGLELLRWWELSQYSLFEQLVIQMCESEGFPLAVHPESGAIGIYQHLFPWYRYRDIRFIGRLADWYNPYDSIIVGVGLFVEEGGSHWANCSGYLASWKGLRTRETLANFEERA